MLISHVCCVLNKCYTSRILKLFLTSHKVWIYVYIYIQLYVYIIASIYKECTVIVCLFRIISTQC